MHLVYNLSHNVDKDKNKSNSSLNLCFHSNGSVQIKTCCQFKYAHHIDKNCSMFSQKYTIFEQKQAMNMNKNMKNTYIHEENNTKIIKFR